MVNLGALLHFRLSVISCCLRAIFSATSAFTPPGLQSFSKVKSKWVAISIKLRMAGIVQASAIISRLYLCSGSAFSRRNLDGFVIRTTQAQRFVTAHAAVHNLFNLGRHLVSAEHYRNLRVSAFSEWSRAVV